MDDSFYISAEELDLGLDNGRGRRRLSFSRVDASPTTWQAAAKDKLRELLALELPAQARQTRVLRQIDLDGVTITALAMIAGDNLTLPAYLLAPDTPLDGSNGVMAIHGHGTLDPCIGSADDYHHSFALELAKQGHLVLCPELRGFGTLKDLALHREGSRLDYWTGEGHMAYSLVTELLLHGKSLFGTTVEDLLAWEAWFVRETGIRSIDVVGISYGGDLAITYPVFSNHVSRIFASGTLGSFSVIFSRCYNAPAHCVPGVLQWMDRSDIAGLNAPRPMAIHYGELDVPSPSNYSASYNETVPQSMQELKEIYAAFGAQNALSLRVSEGRGHEMDLEQVSSFLDQQLPA